MNNEIINGTSNKSQLIALIVLFAVFGVLTVFVLLPYLSAIVVAAITAVVFYPLYERILLSVKHRGFSSLVAIMLLVAIFLLPLSFLAALAFGEAYGAYQSLRSDGALEVDAIARLVQEEIANIVGVTVEPVAISQYAQAIVEWVVKNLGSVFSSIVSGVFTFALGAFILFYLFKDGKEVCRFVARHNPLGEVYTTRLMEHIQTAVISVVRGSFVVALLQGIISGIGFAIFGIPNPALWGGLTVIAALVPTIGTTLVMLPAVIYLFFSGNLAMASGLAIWGVLAVGLIDNFLGPKLMSRKTRLHPLVVFLGVLGGISVFGPIGFIVGPLIFALLFSVAELFSELIYFQPPHAH